MAYAHRTDITVPIMTPTSTTHPDLPSPSSSSHQQYAYNESHENFATSVLLSEHSSASELAADQVPVNDPAALKLEAQSIIDAQKYKSGKVFKQSLDEEIAKLTAEAEERARKRDEAMRVNEGVEEEIKKLEARYETERRALGKRLQGLGK